MERKRGAISYRFGKSVMMIPADEEYFTVNVTVLDSNQFLGWTFSLGEKVNTLNLDERGEEMRWKGERLAQQYEE